MCIAPVQIFFVSITDVSLRQLASTTTTSPTTTGKADTHVCVFQDSASCALSDLTICTPVHLMTCSRLETAPYPLYVMLNESEIGGQTVFDTSFHVDSTCSPSLLGAVERRLALEPDTCVSLSSAPSVCRVFMLSCLDSYLLACPQSIVTICFSHYDSHAQISYNIHVSGCTYCSKEDVCMNCFPINLYTHQCISY